MARSICLATPSISSGTIVPAYFFNSLLGHIPLIGKLFSPEKGGGVFAAKYQVTGPIDNPEVHVNAMSMIAPGFLRNLFKQEWPGRRQSAAVKPCRRHRARDELQRCRARRGGPS